MQALADEGQKIQGMLNQPQSLAGVAQDLSGKLKDAAGKAADPTVRAAIQAVADDLSALAAAADGGDDNAVQNVASKDAHDVSTLIAVCTG